MLKKSVVKDLFEQLPDDAELLDLVTQILAENPRPGLNLILRPSEDERARLAQWSDAQIEAMVGPLLHILKMTGHIVKIKSGARAIESTDKLRKALLELSAEWLNRLRDMIRVDIPIPGGEPDTPTQDECDKLKSDLDQARSESLAAWDAFAACAEEHGGNTTPCMGEWRRIEQASENWLDAVNAWNASGCAGLDS